jgi:DNA-binding MarR family transcriptional regulator
MSEEERAELEGIRDLLHRRALAAYRHRVAVGRLLGLNDTESLALAFLSRTGQLTPGELGRLLSLTSGGVTALCHRLTRAGHLTRRPHPRDKRSSLLQPTPEIVEQANQHFASLVAQLDAVTADTPPDERRAVARFLQRVVTATEREATVVAEAAQSAHEQEQVSGTPSPGLWA